MNESRSPPLSPQNFANGFPFDPWPVNLPSSIDIDHNTLADSLSALNISHSDDQDRSLFPPPSPSLSYGVAASPFAAEGFSSFYEGFRAPNGVNYNQGVLYSGVGHTIHRTVDPFLQEQSASSSSSGFNPFFDLDHRSYLLATERSYLAECLNSVDNRRFSNGDASSSQQSHVNRNNHNVNLVQNHRNLSLMSLHDFCGMICHLAKSQYGCKVLQSKMQNATYDEIQLVFSEIVGSISELMKDEFGYNLIRSLVTVCNDDQKGLIVYELTERPVEFIFLCTDTFGTKAIQKLVENLSNEIQIMRVIWALYRGATELAIDPNGHHVIRDCLLRFHCDYNQAIIDQIADHCLEVSTDKSGCTVMQACIEHSRGDVRKRLVTELMIYAVQLAEDSYGNYVLQHMLELQSPRLTELLVFNLQGYFVSLSQNKFASNVVEKCLQHSGMELAANIVTELVSSPNSSSLLVDQYGNFVIQSALKVSRGDTFDCLLNLILRNVHLMESNMYGKKILARIEKRKFVRG